MDSYTFLFTFGATSASLAEPPDGAADDWTMLRSRSLDPAAHRDRIAVVSTAGAFRRIRLGVRGGALMIEGVRVCYRDGAQDAATLGRWVAQEGFTRPLALSGGSRTIRNVVIDYGRPANSGAVFLDLYGAR